MANDWAALDDNETNALEKSSLCSIYRAPENLRRHGEDKFLPLVVSIGPYHRDKENLQVTEKHKKLYLKYFISRHPSPNFVLDDMVAKIRLVQVAARECYAGDIGLDVGDAFVRMLILDGCFILELFHQHKLNDENRLDEGAILFNNKWSIPRLRRDLVLLENQIPLTVVLCLYCISIGKTTNSITHQEKLEFSQLILSFFHPILPTIQKHDLSFPIPGNHLLDILRNHVLHQPEGNPEVALYAGNNQRWEYSATDLRDAGVLLSRKDTNNGFLDIKFTHGKLEIPLLLFGESRSALFSNMIALEQCRKDYTDQITSYAILMNKFIESEDDVAMLRQEGIIYGPSMKNETILTIVNNLCDGAFVDRFYYDGISTQVDAYLQIEWNKWRARLRREYFNTTWAMTNFLFALYALVLALIQVILGVLGLKYARN